MRHALALILLSAAAFVGCDSKLFSEKAKGGAYVFISSSGSILAKSSEGKYLTSSDGNRHSIQDFVFLQRMEEVETTIETISSLEKQIKSSDDDSPRARELRKEILETRTQLLGILSDIEDAQSILVP